MLQTAATYFATPIYKCQVYFCVIKFRKKNKKKHNKTITATLTTKATIRLSFQNRKIYTALSPATDKLSGSKLSNQS